MDSVFEPGTVSRLTGRLNQLTPESKPLWGKMNVAQMLHHVNMAMLAPLGKVPVKGKPNFIMRIFKSVLYSDKPFGHGNPTPADFKVVGEYDFSEEKQKAIQALHEVADKGASHGFLPHVFFGNLTSEQWGKHFYKHMDHHLRQFGV